MWALPTVTRGSDRELATTKKRIGHNRPALGFCSALRTSKLEPRHLDERDERDKREATERDTGAGKKSMRAGRSAESSPDCQQLVTRTEVTRMLNVFRACNQTRNGPMRIYKAAHLLTRQIGLSSNLLRQGGGKSAEIIKAAKAAEARNP